MFLKGKVAECNKEHYLTLKHITEIKQWHIDSNPKWRELKKQYELIEEVGSFDWTAYLITSFSNAILTQDRIFFVLGRDSFLKKAREDRNWQKSKGYANDKWGIFLKYLTGEKGGHEYIRVYRGGDNNTIIYQLVDEDLLKMLKVDPEKQLQECLEYAKKNDEEVKEKNSNKNNKLDDNYDQDGLQDELQDEVLSNKVVSNCSDSMKEESHDQELTMTILFAEEFDIRIGENKGLLPGKEMIPSLARYAAENLAKENCTASDFKRWLLNLAGGRFGTKKGKKTAKSQKEYAEEYISIFEQCIEEYFYMVSGKKIDIKKPQTIKQNKAKQNKTDKKDVNKDDKETLNAIYSTVGIERVNWLEKNIEKEQDPKEKFMMEWELNRIRSIVYGN